MNAIELLILAIVFGAFVHELGRIKKQLFSIEFRLNEKIDKPTELEKRIEERNKQPKLTKEELDKIMTPEEKAYWTKTNGTGYPNGVE